MKPDFNTITKLAAENKYNIAPVSTEILSDVKTPIEVLRILKNVSSHVYILESVEGHEKWGRYTFLGFDPKLEITCHNGTVKIGSLTFENTNPDTYIRQILSEA